MRFSFALLRACAALLAVTLPAAAEPATTGCSAFLWPLDTERAWMKATDAETVESGVAIPALPAGKAIALALKPVSEVSFPVAPTGTPQADDAKSFGGFVTLDAVPVGHYQITISSHAWIDVAQNGKALDPTAHTGAKGCDGVRKSVRFEIADGPVTIEISGAPKTAIRIAVRPAAD